MSRLERNQDINLAQAQLQDLSVHKNAQKEVGLGIYICVYIYNTLTPKKYINDYTCICGGMVSR